MKKFDYFNLFNFGLFLAERRIDIRVKVHFYQSDVKEKILIFEFFNQK